MTTRSEVELALDRYLAEGGEQVPDRVIDAALDQIDQLPQRRALRVPWRFHDLSTFLKPAIAGAAVVAVLVVGGTYLTGGEAPGLGAGGTTTPSPTATASPSPSAPPSPSPTQALTDTSNWETFTSERYGYEIGHPPSWVVEPATRDWVLERDRDDFRGFGVVDRFHDESANFSVLVSAFAADLPSGTTEDEWIAAYYEGTMVDGHACDELIDGLMESISVDGRPGRIAVNDACSDAQAFVVIDDRMHVFAVWRPRHAALLEAFLSTVDFPE